MEIKIGMLKDFEEGKMKEITAWDKEILVVKIDGNLHAIGDTCTHQECSLSDGFLEGSTVTCPCHNAQFDVKSGKVVEGPVTGEEIKDNVHYKIEVRGEEVFLVS